MTNQVSTTRILRGNSKTSYSTKMFLDFLKEEIARSISPRKTRVAHAVSQAIKV